MKRHYCDLVFEGGGVKGIGIVGAVEVLSKAGYQCRRVAGTSAGAIVGALVAAGMPTGDLVRTMRSLDYRKFRDANWLDKLGPLGKGASLLLEKGIFEGNFLRQWLAVELEQLGVRTFGDLKITESWANKLPPNRRYKLMVIASDISRGQLVRLPWAYHYYGLDPDTQLVADAIHASTATPFFYKPTELAGNYLVDGGVLSNFPIDSFDDIEDWPTFGVKLSAKESSTKPTHRVDTTWDLALALAATVMGAHDQIHLNNPTTLMRTIFIDTFNIQPTQFDITPRQQGTLYQSGKRAAKEFLQEWDYTRYKQANKS